MKPFRIFLSILLALLLSGCAASPEAASLPTATAPLPTQQPAAAPPPIESPAANTPAPAADNYLDDAGLMPPATSADQFVSLARQALARQLNIDPAQVSALKVTEITWPDVRQGCVGSAGLTLSKGRLNGYRVWLQAGGVNYAYQVGLDGSLYLCTN